MPATRVVVVDDHEIMAGSLALPLAAYPDVKVRVIGFDQASAWTSEWCSVDVALLDAADPGHGLDQYPGVRLARHIRRHAGPTVTIAIVTNRYTDDALRARLAGLGRAGADFCFDRDDLRDPRQLHRFVIEPSSQRAQLPAPTDEWLRAHGISWRTDIEAIIDAAAGNDVLRPDSYASRTPSNRRGLDRLLRHLNRLGFGRPNRPERNPTIEQVRRLLNDVLGRRRD